MKISIGDMGESHKPAATWTMKSSLINNGDPEFMAFEQNPGTQGVKFVLDPPGSMELGRVKTRDPSLGQPRHLC